MLNNEAPFETGAIFDTVHLRGGGELLLLILIIFPH